MSIKIYVPIMALTVLSCRDYQVTYLEKEGPQVTETFEEDEPEIHETEETEENFIWVYEPYHGNQVKRYCSDTETLDIGSLCPVVFETEGEIFYLEKGRMYRVYEKRETTQGEVWLAITPDLTEWVASTNFDISYGRYYVIEGEN